MPQLQYGNLYFCNASLRVSKTIENTTINFIIKNSSKSDNVRKVYKTKLGNYAHPNNMNVCLYFCSITLKIFTLPEKF